MYADSTKGCMHQGIQAADMTCHATKEALGSNLAIEGSTGKQSDSNSLQTATPFTYNMSCRHGGYSRSPMKARSAAIQS